MARIARVFLSGVLAALPLLITIFVIGWLAAFIADYAGPTSRFGQFLISLGIGIGGSEIAPYVIGLLLVIAAIYLLGLLVEFQLGDRLLGLFDAAIRRIPIVSNVYDLSKRFTAIVDTKGGDNLKSMTSVWCFFGGAPGAAVLALLPSSNPITIGAEQYLGILIPSAPIPVGGALIYVPAAWIAPAEGGVEHLMSVYVSMGVTPPLGLRAAPATPQV
mgnify:CR=1 FL=1